MSSLSGCAGGGGGDCDPGCASTQECCAGTCVFTGMCTTEMDSGPGVRVDSGPRPPTMCTPECTDTQRCCGGSCIPRALPPGSDGRTDLSFGNCNGCGIACDMLRASSCSAPGGGAGMARCMCGDFNQCLPGEACVSEGGSWLCVSTSTDPANCGMIGNACAEGESCLAGACVCGSSGAACTGGQACCAGTCTDTTADGMNCGGCGNVCSANAPDCQSGSCICGMAGRACAEPVAGALFPPVEAMPGESCCPGMGCVANTDANCACEACTDGDTCVVSGGGFLPGMEGTPEACCGDSTTALLGCGGGGFGLDGGFPMP